MPRRALIRELHIVLTVDKDFIVGSRKLGAVGPQDLDEIVRQGGPGFYHNHPLVDQLFVFLDPMLDSGMNCRLKLQFHSFKKVIKRKISPADLQRGLNGMYRFERRQIHFVTLEVRGSKVVLGGVEQKRRALDKWLRACTSEMWNGRLTPKRAGELAKIIGWHVLEAERRSLKTLRRALGNGLTDRLLKRGEIQVRSANGREYVITKSSRVFSILQDGERRPVCVRVDGEEELPEYDRVIAKYLVIRDHPERIHTLGERAGLVGEMEVVHEEISHLREGFQRFEGRLGGAEREIIAIKTQIGELGKNISVPKRRRRSGKRG